MKHVAEPTFWYFLAHRALDASAGMLPPVFASLDHRAADLGLPIHYPVEHATAWAVLLQLFTSASPYRDSVRRLGFGMMLSGFDRVFAPKGLAELVLTRYLGNLESPALPGITNDETAVDTFLANAMRLKDGRALDIQSGPTILQSCLTDRLMFATGIKAVRPPLNLWDSTAAEYARRRPGFLRRQFSDPNKWLFS